MNKRGRLNLTDVGAAKVLVSVEETALLLSVGRTTVYRLVTRGELRSVRVGRVRRVVVASLHDYVERLLTVAA